MTTPPLAANRPESLPPHAIALVVQAGLGGGSLTLDRRFA